MFFSEVFHDGFSAHLSTRTLVNRIHPHVRLEGLQEELAHRQMDDHIGGVPDGRVQFLLQLHVLGGFQPAREAQQHRLVTKVTTGGAHNSSV